MGRKESNQTKKTVNIVFKTKVLSALSPWAKYFYLLLSTGSIVKELGFWKLTWHNCPARKGLTSEIVRTTLLQHFQARRTVKLW